MKNLEASSVTKVTTEEMIGEDEKITVFSYTQQNQLLQYTNKCFIKF